MYVFPYIRTEFMVVFIYLRTYTQGFYVCVSEYMYMYAAFTFWCVYIYVYVRRVWVGVYVVTCIHTKIACVCVHIYV